jgi:hypothetical protein
MKLFRVVTQEDGLTTKESGKSTTNIIQLDHRYAAENIEEVWLAIEWLRDDPERTVLAIIEEAPAITVIGVQP